jgi:hypothetical protein
MPAYNANWQLMKLLDATEELKLINNRSYIHTYIKSRPFAIGVGRDHFLPLATILTHTFRLLPLHQIPHTRSPVTGTIDLARL